MDTQNDERNSRFLRLPEVKALTGLGKTTIYALQAIGDFPHSSRISPNCVGWDLAAVIDWRQARIAASSGRVSK